MTPDSNETIEEKPGQESQVLAVLGYLPALFFVPLLLGRADRFARFHSKQSLVLFLAFLTAWVAIWLVDLTFGRILGSIVILGVVFQALDWLVHNLVGGLVSLAYVAVMVLAMVQAAMGRFWRLPFLSAYAERLSF